MSSTRPSFDTPIHEYLDAIAKLDLRDGFVAPGDDVAKRLQIEIQARNNCTPAVLAAEHTAGEANTFERQFISAAPLTFTQHALAEIRRISVALTQVEAKSFEVAFHNTPTEPNEWGDKIVVAVRYSRNNA